MKIIIDNAIPFIRGIFEPYSKVMYLKGDEFTHEAVKDADVLIIRTRTRCDEKLLAGTCVKHIATATIGYDHIDIEYCKKHNIQVSTAQGCNARGVLQWVGASLAILSKQEGWQPQQKTIGIVGVGNVGRLIKEYATSWGFKVVCCDPPRKEAEQIDDFVSFEELMQCVDIVTFHTPLNSSTYHMVNRQTLKLTPAETTIINTSRGEVIESEAIKESNEHKILFDVWEHEPNIDKELLERSVISTPHIAGYSLQGKANGTAIVVRDVAQHFNLPIEGWYPEVKQNLGVEIEWTEMCRTIGNYFDIERQSRELKKSPKDFEMTRNNYDYRAEYF